MWIIQISKINRQPSRIMYMVEGKHPRNNSFDAGGKHFKLASLRLLTNMNRTISNIIT